MQCDFCSSKDVVLIAGYRYCAPCSHKFDQILIHNILMNAMPFLTLTQIQQLCSEMFNTKDYCYAEFPRLYKILDRGEWMGREWPNGKFKIPQEEYLMAVFKIFLEKNHPLLFKKIRERD